MAAVVVVVLLLLVLVVVVVPSPLAWLHHAECKAPTYSPPPVMKALKLEQTWQTLFCNSPSVEQLCCQAALLFVFPEEFKV